MYTLNYLGASRLYLVMISFEHPDGKDSKTGKIKIDDTKSTYDGPIEFGLIARMGFREQYSR